VNGLTQTYAYLKNGANPLNGQRLSSDGVNSLTWDASGSNLTRNGTPGNFTFAYDVDNRLTSIGGSAAATYTYDYQGRRTSKTVSSTTTTYLYDGLNLVGETTGGVTASYVFGPGIDEPLASYRAGQLSYLTADALGTISETNDPAGTTTLSTSFDAWGVARNEAGTRYHPFTYTAREVGEAGLLFYRARLLQPGVGRFTQEDPMRDESTSDYAYVDNQPVLFADAFGLAKRRPLPTPTPIPTPTPTLGPTPTPTPTPIPIQRRPPGTLTGYNPCRTPWQAAFWDQFPANPYTNWSAFREYWAAFDVVCLASAPRGSAYTAPVWSSSPAAPVTVGYFVCCHNCDPTPTPTPPR
jgi:RHS repeat-associated protein